MTAKTPQPLPTPIDYYLWLWCCVMAIILGLLGNHWMRQAVRAVKNVGTQGTQTQGTFMSPVAEATLEDLIAYQPLEGQSFGPKTGNDRWYGPHGGVDFDCTAFGMEPNSCAGLDVRAMLPGEVIEVTAIATSANGDAYRVVVLAEDWNGPVEHRYVHVDSLTVAVGDRVELGQTIAKIAPTDSVSSGVHLDIKIWRAGDWYDPQVYFQEALDMTVAAQDLVTTGSELSDELIQKAIGAAEGTVDWETLEPDADYHGHPDPCVKNNTCPGRGENKGFFSYDKGKTPEEANQLQMVRLRDAETRIQQQAIAKFGTKLSKAAIANALDLWNQAPLAGEDFIRLVASADPTPQQIIDARVKAYYDPATGRLNAPGLGNTRLAVIEDQRRRTGAVLYVLERLN